MTGPEAVLAFAGGIVGGLIWCSCAWLIAKRWHRVPQHVELDGREIVVAIAKHNREHGIRG